MRFYLGIFLFSLALILHTGAAAQSVSLAGTWRVALDPDDRGAEVLGDESLASHQRGTVWLPGSITAQGYGDDPFFDSPWVGNRYGGGPLGAWVDRDYGAYLQPNDNFKMPFWLTPDKVYVGQAWYERQVSIPEAWAGMDIHLFLERTHWVTEAWLDGQRLGTRDSLTTPHIYAIENARPGTYTLRLRVDNRMHINVGPNAHSVSDHTQGNWNGVVGKMELRAQPKARIDHVRVDGDVADRAAEVIVSTANTTSKPIEVALSVEVRFEGQLVADAELSLTIPAEDVKTGTVRVALGDDAKLWDEFNPNLYDVSVTLDSSEGSHAYDTTFGLREITTDGTRVLLNGRPIFLRGTLDCLIYPRTGYPPMDEAGWEKVFTRLKQFGLNHLRFHSWCPPQAAFAVADRMGIYLQAEGPFWANQGSQLGLGLPIDAYVYAENDRILDQYGNHASFVMMAYGNEPSGPKVDGSRGQGQKFLIPWLEHVRTKDARRLYTSGAGWPAIAENDYHNIPNPRIQQWGSGLNSILNARPPQTVADHGEVLNRFDDMPIVAHEVGQWCVYPDFTEMGKYHGLLRPKNFEIFQDMLHKNGMGHLERDFLMASGALQVLCYKADIEMALRTPGFGGFQLLDLHDFPGQGTALVGVLDPFWDPKPYITGEQWRMFCGPTVPLARMEQRLFESGQSLTADIEISHFGAADEDNAKVNWSLVDDDGRVLAKGSLRGDLPAGELTRVGSITVPMRTSVPMRATLHVKVASLDAHNSWEVWCYPEDVSVEPPSGVYVTRVLDDMAEQKLADGGTVLLLADPARVDGGVSMGFSSPFWNYAWTNGREPHTLGVLVDPKHPLYETFPTDIHTDWQWWSLVRNAGAMIVDDLPQGLEPLVRPIDTWFRARRLASLFEANANGGRLVVCSMDLSTDLDSRPAARQFRHSLMRYLGSEEFDPQTEVELDAVRALFRGPTLAERMGIVVSASSAQGGFEAVKAVDGDPTTMWHTDFSGNIMQPHPHHLTLAFDNPTRLTGLGYSARQDSANGRIGRYAVHVSDDGEDWGEPIATGTFNGAGDEQVIRFDKPMNVRFIRLVALNSLNGVPHSAVVELRPIMP